MWYTENRLTPEYSEVLCLLRGKAEKNGMDFTNFYFFMSAKRGEIAYPVGIPRPNSFEYSNRQSVLPPQNFKLLIACGNGN